MGSYVTNKLVSEIEMLAVTTALTKLDIAFNQSDEDVSSLLASLNGADQNIHNKLSEFIEAYRNYASFCEKSDAEGNGGKLCCQEQFDEYYRLSQYCEKKRHDLIQALNVVI